MRQVLVNAEYDNGAKVWYILDSSLSGLFIEGDTYEQFVQEVKWGIESLLESDEQVDLVINAKANHTFKLSVAA